jgi:hypothetical protein
MEYYLNGKIDYFNFKNKSPFEREESLYEYEARQLALVPLLADKCDYIVLLDILDEFWTETEISNLIEYISRDENQYYVWFKVRYKNIILDGKHYVDDFAPPRVFKVNINNQLKLDKFFFDNDIYYKSEHGVEIDYRQLPNKEIPRNLVFPRHETWLDNEESRRKILYHEKHFKNGFGCSYKWENGHLKINEEYYQKLGISLPIVYKDE